MVLAFLNNKGGVAKTTTAVNVAAGLALRGRKTLLIDLDSQGSASFSLGVPREELAPSSADALLYGVPILDMTRTTDITGLHLVTGSMELAETDIELSTVKGRENRLSEVLIPVRTSYDYVIVDCPPSLALLPVNALLAADAYIVPVVPHYLALEGLVNLMTAVSALQQSAGREIPLLGLVLTMVDRRTRAAGEIINMIREHYGKKVFEREINMNVRLSEAPSFGQPIFQYDPASTGAAAYGDLTDEIIKRSKTLKK
jgi:chromosome partitioning protein